MQKLFPFFRSGGLLCFLIAALPWAARAQNVGIGTTAPTQQLDVNGNLRVRGLSGTDNRLPIVQPDGTLGVSQPITPVTVLGSPVNLGNLTVNAPAGVAVSGNYLYVTHTSPNELLVFDITNPTTPVAVPGGTVAGGTLLDLLTVSGGYVYVCDINADNVRVYSLLPGTTPAGSPTAPAYLGSFTTEDQPNGAVVVGTNLYIADYGTGHIQVFNLTGAGGSVTAPPLLGTFSTGSGPSGLAVSPDSRYLYVTNYAANRLQVFDLSVSATAPTLVTTLTPGSQPNAVAVANNLLYLTNAASNTLYTYGLSTPGTPVYQSSTPTAGRPYGFDVKGNYAYLTNVTSNQLRVLQLTQSNSVGFNSSGQLTSVPNSALGDNLGNGVAATNVNLNGNLLVGGTLGSPGTTGLFVSSAGNVGINTSTPAQKLDVNGNANLTGSLQLSSADGDKIFLTAQGAAGSKIGHLANWGVASYAGPGNAVIGFHAWSVSAVAGYAEKMRLTANGYLGLGTATPFSQLANTSNNIIGADGDGGNPGTLTWEANQAGYVGGFYNGGTAANSHGLVVKVAGTTAAALDVSQNAAVGTAGTSLLRVRADGNVGLGTLSPSARLHVAGTAGTSNVRLESLGGTGSRMVTADASGNLGSAALPTAESTTASNGLTRTGTDVALGGTLTGATTLTTASNALRVNVSAAGGAFQVQSNGSTSLLVDANGRVGVARGGATTSGLAPLYTYSQQLTADGDGQATTYAYRTRDSQNDGTGYGQFTSNSASLGYNHWGDLYTFGTTGFSDNDYTRTGGVLGAVSNGTYWGVLGYKSSSTTTYGVYGSAAYANGAGRAAAKGAAPATEGIGLGIYGGAMGGWVRGEALGLVSSGPVFAAYNVGDEYTSGRQAELVTTATGQRQAAYSMTSAESKAYEDGVAQLRDGRATVAWPTGFAALIGKAPVVTVTPVGECQGLHLVSVDGHGFTVAENGGGHSQVSFNWIAVGQRLDATQRPVPAELLDPTFDQQLTEVMTNDNTPGQQGTPLWYDGQRTRFAPGPAAQRPVVKAAR